MTEVHPEAIRENPCLWPNGYRDPNPSSLSCNFGVPSYSALILVDQPAEELTASYPCRTKISDRGCAAVADQPVGACPGVTGSSGCGGRGAVNNNQPRREPVDGRYSIVRYSSRILNITLGAAWHCRIPARHSPRSAIHSVRCRAPPHCQPKISPQSVQRTVAGAGMSSRIVTSGDARRMIPCPLPKPPCHPDLRVYARRSCLSASSIC